MTTLPRDLDASCGCDAASGLISIDTALDRITQAAQTVAGVETVPLHLACGRVLAAPICARSDMPRFDHSAMDGYAIKTDELAGDGPWVLPIVGRTAAGEPALASPPCHGALRIFTGAPIPPGMDCVVMQEEVLRRGESIVLQTRPRPMQNIRVRAEECAQGDEIVPPGTRLTPRAIAASAAAGQAAVTVRRKIRVTLLVSGSEVIAPGAVCLEPAQIWDVNTPMLATALDRPDVELVSVAAIADTPAAIRDALAEAALRSDVIITTGGVSVGEEDHLRAAITASGGTIRFAGVAIKPGKPVCFGTIGAAHWLGLPGNPQSAFVTWTLFGAALLRHLSGLARPDAVKRCATLSTALRRKPGRCEIRAARVLGFDGTGREVVDCCAPVHSGQVGALSAADGLVFLPADADALPAGALVDFLPFVSC